MGLFDKFKPQYYKTQQQRKESSINILKANGVKVFENLPVIERYEQTTIRTKDEVVKRTIAICIVAVYAEGFLTETPIKENQEFIKPIIERYNAAEFFTEKEKAFLNNEDPLAQEATNYSWQYECFNVLLWVLNFTAELSFPNGICNVSKLVNILSSTSNYEQFFDNATLRSKEEIMDQADLIYRYDWACVDARINDRVVENLHPGVVLERHRALNWLVNYMDQDWDNITTDT